jgi:gluconolactonase
VVGHVLTTVIDGLDHPEGICWSPPEQTLYAGGEAGQVYRFALGNPTVELVTTVAGGFLLGLALDGAGVIYICDVAHACVQRVDPGGRVERYGEPIPSPNYPVFDGQGRLWVSATGSWEQAGGAIVRIDPDGATERVLDDLRFANGLAISEGWLYAVESAWPRVIRVPLDGGAIEPVVEFERVVPDGLAFDAEGGLWIGCWQPNRIYRLTPDEILDTIVDDWTGEYILTPTNLAFAGPDLDVLVIASLAGQAVKAIDPGVRGAPLAYPKLVAA